jgi:hypothetical protein
MSQTPITRAPLSSGDSTEFLFAAVLSTGGLGKYTTYVSQAAALYAHVL